jgi:natural product precursor
MKEMKRSKLFLDKKTVSDLDSDEMKAIKGGIFPIIGPTFLCTIIGCPTITREE